eukprot:10859664-Prorocentrum_lima.AAC.1
MSPGGPFALWDSGAAHFLLPMTSLQRSATGTSRAVVRPAVGDAQAVYCNDEVSCQECRTPLIRANNVVHTLGLVAYMSVKKGTL